MRIFFVGIITMFFSLSSTHFSTAAESRAVTTLERYAPFLEKGTYGGRNLLRSGVLLKSRYFTFQLAFAYLEESAGKIVVELGTTRSFVNGNQPGCLSGDKKYWKPGQPEIWDWGAGFFTRVAAECLHHLMPEIHTVDISAEHIRRSKIITEEFADIMHYHVCSSVTFLKNWDARKCIDLLYMDAGDTNEVTARMHLQEAKIIVERDLIGPGGYILIDDANVNAVDVRISGKSHYSLPYLLEHGFELVADEFQVILQKSS